MKNTLRKRKVFLLTSFWPKKKDLSEAKAYLETLREKQSELLKNESLQGQAGLSKGEPFKGIFLKLKETFTDLFFSTSMFPYLLLDQIEGQIKADLPLWRKHNSTSSNFFPKKFRVVGPQSGALFLHKDASILPGSVFDTRSGPIIIDKGVQVSAFSYLCGPLYVAPHAQLDNLHIRGGSILGEGRTARRGN